MKLPMAQNGVKTPVILSYQGKRACEAMVKLQHLAGSL
jgi:hypothetical protein